MEQKVASLAYFLISMCLIVITDEIQVKRSVAARGRANTKLGGNRPLISRPLDFRHEQHIGLDNLGSGANDHSTGMVTSHSMQAGLNQTGSDSYSLTKVSAGCYFIIRWETMLNFEN